MKLEKEKVEIEASGLLKTMSFGIADAGFTIGIMRDKIYSDKVRAVVQEYMCNARDAHREAGQTKPIKVTAPSVLDPNWRCRDYGNSISPEKMEDVFVKYGASTKRSDNKQTGGYGIGGKTGFCYGSGAFGVETFINGVKRSYTAYIDDSNCGIMALLSEEPTTEPNGVEIVVPVEKQDFQEFARKSAVAAACWTAEEKPDFCSTISAIEQVKFSPIFSGKNWKLSANNRTRDGMLGVSLDGILYDVPTPSGCLFAYDYNTRDKFLSTLSYCCSFLILNFQTGEIAVNAARENLELTPAAKELIRERLKSARTEFITMIQDEIDLCKTQFQAIKKADEIAKKLGDHRHIFEEYAITWAGHKIPDACFSGKTKLYSFSHYSVNTDGEWFRLDTAKGTFHYKQEDTVFVHVTPTEKQGVRSTKFVGIAAEIGKVKNSNNIVFVTANNTDFAQFPYDKSGTVKFSDYYKPTTPKVITNFPDYVFNLFALDGNLDTGMFYRTSLKAVENSNAKLKIWCRVESGYIEMNDYGSRTQGHSILLKTGYNGKLLRPKQDIFQSIRQMSKTMDANAIKPEEILIVGIPTDVPVERIKKDLPEFISIDDYIKKFFDSINIDMKDINAHTGLGYHAHENNKRLVVHPNGMIRGYAKKVQEYQDIQSKINNNLTSNFLSYVFQNNPQNRAHLIAQKLDLEWEKVTKSYPMLSYIAKDQLFEKEILEYLDMVNDKNKLYATYAILPPDNQEEEEKLAS